MVKTKIISLAIKQSIYDSIQAEAERQQKGLREINEGRNVSMADVIRQALEHYFRKVV